MKVGTEYAIVDTGFSFQLLLSSEISWFKVGEVGNFGDVLNFVVFFRIPWDFLVILEIS